MSIEVHDGRLCRIVSDTNCRLSIALRSGERTPYKMYWPPSPDDNSVSFLRLDYPLAAALRDVLIECLGEQGAKCR
jgi:hypothetical protein